MKLETSSNMSSRKQLPRELLNIFITSSSPKKAKPIRHPNSSSYNNNTQKYISSIMTNTSNKNIDNSLRVNKSLTSHSLNVKPALQRSAQSIHSYCCSEKSCERTTNPPCRLSQKESMKAIGGAPEASVGQQHQQQQQSLNQVTPSLYMINYFKEKGIFQASNPFTPDCVNVDIAKHLLEQHQQQQQQQQQQPRQKASLPSHKQKHKPSPTSEACSCSPTASEFLLPLRVSTEDLRPAPSFVLSRPTLNPRTTTNSWALTPLERCQIKQIRYNTHNNSNEWRNLINYGVTRKLLDKYSYLSSYMSEMRLRKLLRPQIYLDFEISLPTKRTKVGRLVFQMFTEICPSIVLELVKTCCQNKFSNFHVTNAFKNLWIESSVELPTDFVKSKCRYKKKDQIINHGSGPGVLSFPTSCIVKGKRNFNDGQLLGLCISFVPLSVPKKFHRIPIGILHHGHWFLKDLHQAASDFKNPARCIHIIRCGALKYF